jgi:L-serine dehydratase
MKTSLFDLFKIGIGPSSSHTVGPMRAAKRFADLLLNPGDATARIRVELYGSLALTGKGHGTDRAILLGLAGESPDLVEPGEVDLIVERIRREKRVGRHPFDEDKDLIFHADLVLPGHPNGMRFTAYDADRREIRTKVYFSIGGGFIAEEGESSANTAARAPVPYSFTSSAELLSYCKSTGLSIPELMLENEKAWRSEAEVRDGILRIWRVMQDCTDRGMVSEGILPGGLHVKRRAPGLRRKLDAQGLDDSLAAMDWVNLFAIAVNEENASGGRVVTAPTNGAAGVIPAVANYYMKFCRGDREGILRYFLAAAAIGVLYKENASISGAEVGCQGEVGVACSMAAGGLVAALGGSSSEIEHAAEIGMEHNLGMTCDPIAGLVQVPCIERNAFGAVKAVNAARMAMRETDGHVVSLDQVIKTMYQTGLDMQSKYKETSLAGLAVNVVEC